MRRHIRFFIIDYGTVKIDFIEIEINDYFFAVYDIEYFIASELRKLFD